MPWLSRLEPVGSAPELVPASGGAQFNRAVRNVGGGPARWAVEVGHQAAERVAAEIPGHVANGSFDVLRMGTESTTIQLMLALAVGEFTAPVTAESLGGIPDFVRRRVTLDELLRGIQLGHSVIAGAFLAECARLGDVDNRHEQMRTLSQQMFDFFDAFSTQMATAYREEELRWAQSEAATRISIVERLLQGRDQPIAAASRRLRYDLSRSHVAVIIWSSARTLDADQAALYEAARELLRQLGCDQKLVLSVSLGVVWAWVTPREGASPFAQRLASAVLPPEVHAVFGEDATGAAGFCASHSDAQAAFALRSKSLAAAPVTSYRDLDLVSLLLADRARALRFARRELGALAASDLNMPELRRTLAVYLEEGGSPQAAAQRLRVSRNTVTSRVRRAEELLGREIGERRLHVQAALAILEEIARQPAGPPVS